MKITFLLFFTTLMQVSATSIAQKITYHQKEATLKQIFTEINKQTGFNVFWSPKVIRKVKK
ncbi:hypothetical protein HK413_02175 [Mucilaginibacter sp. S1162]|uniref:Uncharacterized protein n=1 Tax=Mucilaginibacter humi TaxID=2732510 RepID=A0ABX1W4R6_9SPHI|nr:hypothetical protein [Mucilaginibacter humi]NNU33270.1 hypothetical protein [Mucilaginibacter humi]